MNSYLEIVFFRKTVDLPTIERAHTSHSRFNAIVDCASAFAFSVSLILLFGGLEKKTRFWLPCIFFIIFSFFVVIYATEAGSNSARYRTIYSYIAVNVNIEALRYPL